MPSEITEKDAKGLMMIMAALEVAICQQEEELAESRSALAKLKEVLSKYESGDGGQLTLENL